MLKSSLVKLQACYFKKNVLLCGCFLGNIEVVTFQNNSWLVFRILRWEYSFQQSDWFLLSENESNYCKLVAFCKRFSRNRNGKKRCYILGYPQILSQRSLVIQISRSCVNQIYQIVIFAQLSFHTMNYSRIYEGKPCFFYEQMTLKSLE